jgi:catechol 2,3-dioxygenase-like lactoylglutathione lyase family enzyme
MDKSGRRVKGLGEVSIRVKDLDAMQKFYEEVVGLELLRREGSIVFFKIAEGYGGHMQNLALFGADNLDFLENKAREIGPEKSTLHHIALNIALEDHEAEKAAWKGWGYTLMQPIMPGCMFIRYTSPIRKEI